MKKFLTIILTGILAITCCFGLAGCSGNKAGKIKGYKGDVVGVDIYLMALVCEELDMKMEVKDVDFDGIVGAIATKNNAVGAAGITITDERLETVDFSNAYYSSVQYIISKKTDGFTTIEQLAGKKIGVQKGTTGALMVDEACNGGIDENDQPTTGILQNSGASCIEYNTGAEAFTAMKTGKCDFVVIDELPAQKIVNGQADYVAKPIEGIEVEQYGFCISKTSSIKNQVIVAMNKVIADSKIDEIVSYFTSVSNDEEPVVDLEVVNLADNKGEVLEVYTCSGFEPYEFVLD